MIYQNDKPPVNDKPITNQVVLVLFVYRHDCKKSVDGVLSGTVKWFSEKYISAKCVGKLSFKRVFTKPSTISKYMTTNFPKPSNDSKSDMTNP